LKRTLNLGILAHADAGRTSLTERLPHAAGVIDEIGGVDDGSTPTDSLALERQPRSTAGARATTACCAPGVPAARGVRRV
jgi:translation elongation factor EF-G